MGDQLVLINEEALFCDETEDYRNPAEPQTGDTARLWFRTAKDDVDQVIYCEHDKNIEVVMKKSKSTNFFDYYECQIEVAKEMIHYFFQIKKANAIFYYHRMGLTNEKQNQFSFAIKPDFCTPEWAKGAVMYQIFVDRFYRGDEANDVLSNEYLYIGSPVRRIDDWFKKPDDLDVGSFYGGDLKGVSEKLDYLQQLGIEVIYFNPIFVSPSNHKYDCQDYDHIDPHYGVIVKDGGDVLTSEALDNTGASKYQIRTASPENLAASDQLFRDLVEEIHKRNMRVIIDGVFNHCGSFNKWLDREMIYQKAGIYESGAYVSADSPYHSFFRFQNQEGWPHNTSYDGWWGHSTLPKLNYEGSEKLYQYILEIARKWVLAPYCVDGWRLDVAADLGHSSDFNHQFWKAFRMAVKEANPEALILAEHYGDPSSWLQGDEWDTIMNYDAFMEPVTWFLTGMEKHSDEYNPKLEGDGVLFFESMRYHMSRMHMSSILTSMNELSNHDHSRFLTRTNKQVGRIHTAGAAAAEQGLDYAIFRAGVVMLMTWPGAPTIYYGDEVGVCGWTDPDNRRTYPWSREDLELLEFHRYMVRLHKQIPALKKGSVKRLLADQGLVVYGRSYQNSKAVVAVNSALLPRQLKIPVWQIGLEADECFIRVMLTSDKGYNVGVIRYMIKDGFLILELEGKSSILLKNEE